MIPLEKLLREKKKQAILNQDIIRKKKLIRKKEPTPWELLEGFGMQHDGLLNIISDNTQIPNYIKIRKAEYFCDVGEYRVILHFNGYREDDATCNSLTIIRGAPAFLYDVKEKMSVTVYMENGQLIKKGD